MDDQQRRMPEDGGDRSEQAPWHLSEAAGAVPAVPPPAGPFGVPSPPPAWALGEPATPPPGTMVMIPVKSPGIAVLLSFLWLGAGNLYVNQIGLGIALLMINFFLVLMAATLIGAVFAVPVWVLLFVIAAATSATAASQHNRRLGVRG